VLPAKITVHQESEYFTHTLLKEREEEEEEEANREGTFWNWF